MVSTYRVAVLGARGVGKSAIVRQFLYNEFSEVCVPTTARRLYLPAVVMNGHVHDLQILDFPPNSAQTKGFLVEFQEGWLMVKHGAPKASGGAWVEWCTKQMCSLLSRNPVW